MTPKDWNTQDEAIAAAKAEILAAIRDTDARLELGMVKSVQSGRAYANKGGTFQITIHTVNPQKCMVIIDSASYSSGSYGYNTYFSGLNETSLQIYLYDTGYSKPSVGWQVIEFY